MWLKCKVVAVSKHHNLKAYKWNGGNLVALETPAVDLCE
jgi:hypothetical protein